jgi:hypothetical protein
MGRYRDGASWAFQGEVRQHLFGKFGVVAFGGVGGIAEGVGDKHSTGLVAGGGGLRYIASKSNNVNLRLDIPWAKTAMRSISVSVRRARCVSRLPWRHGSGKFHQGIDIMRFSTLCTL